MFRLWNVLKSKLTWYLLGSVVAAGVISFGCSYILIYLGQSLIETRFDDVEFNVHLQKKYIRDLQDYITLYDIEVSDVERLKDWTDRNYYVDLVLYYKQEMIFNSNYANIENETGDAAGKPVDTEGMYPLKMTDDRVVYADMFCYDYWQYYYYICFVCVIFGVILFIGIFTGMLHKKLSYINLIEKELRILEGGNLEYPITIKGADEISSLASGIEQMRLSIVENMKKERLLLQSNKDLVTALSHDLRTPLTTLTGYLEILNMKGGKSEQEKEHYLALSLAKTREIKELSDELFEYFLIYGEEQKKLDVDEVPAYVLVEELVGNQFLGLEEAGYELNAVNCIDTDTGNCRINAKYLQRVLNNILSNLEKYADKDKPIEVSAMKEQNFLVIRVRNGIRSNLEPHESTKIGLITCERIMKLHRGEFQKYDVGGEFVVKLGIPLTQEERKELKC